MDFFNGMTLDQVIDKEVDVFLRNGNKKTNLVRVSHVVKVHQSQEISDGQTSTTG